MNDIAYRDRATEFKPRTPPEIASAARDLAASGFSAFTVATVLGIDVGFARQLIGPPAGAAREST